MSDPIQLPVVFSTSGLLHASIKPYYAAADPHLADFHRRPRRRAPPLDAKPASVLELRRRERASRHRGLLAENARARADVTSPATSVERGSGGEVRPATTDPLDETNEISRPPRMASVQLRVASIRNQKNIPFEHQSKLRVLDRYFELYDVAEKLSAQHAEFEHYRILEKQTNSRLSMDAEGAALRLQFATRMQRKVEREAFPCLKRASSLATFGRSQ